MSEAISDGQHKFGNAHSCFFCMKDKQNCQLFSMKQGSESQPGMEEVYRNKFVVCQECWAKGPEFLAKHLVHWATTAKS